ncbi:fasciclin domain-containing protein [Sphingobacterium sp. IITKGP-BTPF85]|uniref:fasciclin domain-containing protein n=1 Tax=Sphingobacterium sp. IITKGP-BTPF85 TaxID=1338009 RepID=UPI00038A1051|nr:fasciclin domain-containing protein [Sphingobacterium sp. IITKGP-BTPF85]
MNYKIIDKRWYPVRQYVLFMLSFFLFSCEHPDLTVVVPNENLRPASDFIKNNYEMTLFSAALEKVGLASTLNEKGPYTVLVPTDAAFNELGIFRPSDFDKMNLDSLKKVIQYHILPRRMLLRDIPSNGVDVRYATLAGSELYASLGSVGPNGGTPTNELFSVEQRRLEKM